MEAPQTATLNPARFLDKEKDFGTIAVGKMANLVLLDANPLDNIENTRKIAGVLFQGKFIAKGSLDRMLVTVEALSSRKPIGDILFETIREKDADAAVKQFRDLRSAHPDAYDFSENELVGLGYQLIRMKNYKGAIVIFKLSVENFPQSYNKYDSLAEAYLDDDDKKLAIANYQKSLELNPENTNAAKKLKQLNSQ